MFRIEKKSNRSGALLFRVISVVAALIVAGIFLAVCGYNPLQVYGAMLTGSFSTAYYRSQLVEKMVPLVMMALGVSVCFKMKFLNIGAEGQLCMGAVGATWVALFLTDVPTPLRWVLMFVVAFACGGLWCLIAGALKARWGVNDTLVTLMMNYIAIKIVTYLQYTAWKDPKTYGYPKIANFPKELQLTKWLGPHIGWIFAVLAVALVWIFLKRSKKGFEISVMGDSESAARYAGINTNKLLLLVSLLGGGLCGLAGMIQASGALHTLNDSISGGMGYTAIVVAYMAGMEPIGIVVVAFLFSMLLQGGAYMQIAMQIPTSAANVVQGIILLFVLACEFFTAFRIVRVQRQKGDN